MREVPPAKAKYDLRPFVVSHIQSWFWLKVTMNEIKKDSKCNDNYEAYYN